jgi:membrane protein YqaA with SNARE-associated domain
MDIWINQWLQWMALPQHGLSTLFVVAFISATLLPMGSEPVLFGLVKLNPELFWPAIVVATAGNTIGGAISWWMGYEAHALTDKVQHKETTGNEARALRWLHALGPKACLLSWLPGVGDPLCAVAGWLRLPFWPCVAYMAVGKFARYVIMTGALVWAVPTDWLP